jgi:hypothetical protein
MSWILTQANAPPRPPAATGLGVTLRRPVMRFFHYVLDHFLRERRPSRGNIELLRREGRKWGC